MFMRSQVPRCDHMFYYLCSNMTVEDFKPVFNKNLETCDHRLCLCDRKFCDFCYTYRPQSLFALTLVNFSLPPSLFSHFSKKKPHKNPHNCSFLV